MRAWLGWSLVLAVGCRGEVELVSSDCGGEACPVCEADADCVIAHNPCQPTATCGHVDEGITVTLEACSAALQYVTPPASACTCAAERCAAVE